MRPRRWAQRSPSALTRRCRHGQRALCAAAHLCRVVAVQQHAARAPEHAGNVANVLRDAVRSGRLPPKAGVVVRAPLRTRSAPPRLTAAQVRRVLYRRSVVVQVGVRAQGRKGAKHRRCRGRGRHVWPARDLHVHGLPACATAEALCVIYTSDAAAASLRQAGKPGSGGRLKCAQPASPPAAPSWRPRTGTRFPRS